MIVQFIQPIKFLSWARGVEVALPGSLSLFLGPNGSGKTALALESVAWCLWKQTVRGTKPKGEVNVTLEKGGTRWRVERTESTVVLGEDVGTKWVDRSGQTPTETQGKIERIFGSWRRFAATRVFSRRLVNRFGAATDKDRKALLEEVLGLDRFERAYAWAREERGRRDQAHRDAHSTAMTKQAAADQADGALQAAVDRPGELATDVQAKQVQVGTRREALAEKAHAVEKDHGNATRAVEALSKAHQEASVAGQAIERQMSAIERSNIGENCPTCGSPLKGTAEAAAHRAKERARLGAELAPLQRKAKLLADQLGVARQKASSLATEHGNLAREIGALDREASALAERHKAAREREALLDDLGARKDRAVAEAQEAQAALLCADAALAAAEHACRILGPKGARVRLMAVSLVQLEIGANAVLPRLGGQVRAVRISGTKTKADGDEVAEVTLKVEGAGGGDYKGTSDGELARVDASLVLALARLSGDRGYVCFDEPFDGLDREGLAGVCEVLKEMAEERQVVVVTHSEDLVSMFPAAQRFICSRAGDGPSQLEAA